MYKRKIFGFLFILIGVFLGINSYSGITGNAIIEDIPSGFSGILSLIFVIIGLVLSVSGNLEGKVEEGETEIDGVVYDNHALKRMEKRKVFPMLVKSTIDQGKHYPLTHVENTKETSGATEAYVLDDIQADILPGGRIGERIISIDKKDKKSRYNHLVVLTDSKGVVKTTYCLRDESELNHFLDSYTRTRKAA